MNTLEEYMRKPYRIEIIPDVVEGGYVAAYPDLKGCLSSGETIEEAVANAEGAKREWLIAAMEEGYPIPDPASD